MQRPATRIFLTLLGSALIALACIQAAEAEIYQGIGPLDTMADLKMKYPHATFEQLHPAWAQEQDVMYSITGHGLSGLIIVKFVDHRPEYRRRSLAATDEATITLLTHLMNLSDDDSLGVDWVRWIPAAIIPLQRLVAKVGPPEEKGFASDDLQPYRHWAKKGLVAYLSDDEKTVVRIDYEFTPTEYCATWHTKFPQVPYTDAAGNDLCVSAKHPASRKPQHHQ